MYVLVCKCMCAQVCLCLPVCLKVLYCNVHVCVFVASASLEGFKGTEDPASMALVLPCQGASSGAGLRNPVISAEWGWVGTVLPLSCSLQGLRGCYCVRQCRTNASLLCPCPLNHPKSHPSSPPALPSLLLFSAIPRLSCCTFQSTIAPQRPGWWQNP